MTAPGHGREKCSHAHYCNAKADASDSHQSSLLNCCLNPGDVSVQAPQLQLQSHTPRLAFCVPGFLAPLVGRPRRLAPLTSRGSGFDAVGEVVGVEDRAAADLHLPGQLVEAPASLAAAINLRSDVLVLRLERLAGLATLAATAINPAGRPRGAFPSIVQRSVFRNSHLVPVGSSSWRSFWGSRNSTYARMSPRPALAGRKVPPESSEQVIDGRRLPIRQLRIDSVAGAQCTRLFGGIAYLCERHSRVTPTHESL